MEVYKPNPLFYKTILHRSGWAVEECLFVGYSYVEDVCGPKFVEMRTVLLDRKEMYKYVALNHMPDYIIHSLTELKDIL